MLGNKEAVANLAVKDIDRARKFYEETLGLTPIETEGDDMVVFQSGVSTLNVYCSQYAGTNQATAVTWAVGDEIEALVSELKAKGVRFEHYDMPDTRLEGDIHVVGRDEGRVVQGPGRQHPQPHQPVKRSQRF